MQLRDAIVQISEIHAQVLRSEVFRGYRALPMAVTSALAPIAAAAQSVWVEPSDLAGARWVWLAYASACALVCGGDITWHACARGRRFRLQAQRVVAQFLPSLAAGAVVTWVLARSADAASLLPGIWVLLFALGIFATLPYLPRSLLWVALLYLTGGAALLLGAAPGLGPAPWALGILFGTGQGLTAVLLHRELES